MIKVVIETPAQPWRGRRASVRVVELTKLTHHGGTLACPRCGDIRFTAQVNESGELVLSCVHESTHLRFTTHQE